MQTFTTTGVMTNDHTLTLDQPLPVVAGRVEIIVNVLQEQPAKESLEEFMKAMWNRQQERGHVAPTAEEVAEYIRTERASWDDE